MCLAPSSPPGSRTDCSVVLFLKSRHRVQSGFEVSVYMPMALLFLQACLSHSDSSIMHADIDLASWRSMTPCAPAKLIDVRRRVWSHRSGRNQSFLPLRQNGHGGQVGRSA